MCWGLFGVPNVCKLVSLVHLLYASATVAFADAGPTTGIVNTNTYMTTSQMLERVPAYRCITFHDVMVLLSVTSVMIDN